jgi:hypothetical protein
MDENGFLTPYRGKPHLKKKDPGGINFPPGSFVVGIDDPHPLDQNHLFRFSLHSCARDHGRAGCQGMGSQVEV